MTPRPITDLDMVEVHRWWEEQGWPKIPKEMLPTTGWIVEHSSPEGIDGVCAGWLYKANSAMAKLEWVVGNPSIPAEKRSEGLNLLIEHISQEARLAGYTALFTSTKHTRLIERLKLCGYTVGDEGVTHLFKRL